MANDQPKRWERQVREAALRVEEDLRRVVAYINDQVVPDVRRDGSQALRAAAEQLQKLAQRMDDRRAAAHGRVRLLLLPLRQRRTSPALNRIAHRRRRSATAPGRALGRILNWALLPALVLGLAGCRHKNKTAIYQPPPPLTRPLAARPPRVQPTQRSQPGHAQRLRTGTTASAPQPLPHGKPVSSEVGLASWYGPPYANRKAADGSVYDQNAMTAAHRTLPMGSIVRVTNLANDQSVVVRITDRGPFVGDRIIDLSLAAAKETGVYRAGVARVRVEAYAPPVHPGVDPAGKGACRSAHSPTRRRHQAQEQPPAPLLDRQGHRVRRPHRPLGAHQPA